MIAIGRITKSVGTKGEVNVLPLTDSPNRFAHITSVWLGLRDEEGERRGVITVRSVNGRVVLKLDGVDSRTEADGLRGKYLLVPDEQAIRKNAQAYFLHELIGLKVITEEGEAVGVVEDIRKLPGSDIWVVRRGNKEVLIPGVKEFIRSVNVKQGTVMIHTMEGLLE